MFKQKLRTLRLTKAQHTMLERACKADVDFSSKMLLRAENKRALSSLCPSKRYFYENEKIDCVRDTDGCHGARQLASVTPPRHAAFSGQCRCRCRHLLNPTRMVGV